MRQMLARRSEFEHQRVLIDLLVKPRLKRIQMDYPPDPRNPRLSFTYDPCSIRAYPWLNY